MNKRVHIHGKIVAALLCVLAAFTSLAQTSNAPPAIDFPSFRIITERNIFNPNRYGRRSSEGSRQTTRRVRAEYFALLGTMAYEKGSYAFFDGSRSDYAMTLKTDDLIGGYKIADITTDHVKL